MVWVRLNELSIELYDLEVLKQIGESIRKVLRIDSHTTTESRGKYARLCIQIDLNKPFINTVIIGRFEQGVTYKVLHRLCFSCGRVGHKTKNCPYTIRKGKNLVIATEEGQEAQPSKPRVDHEVSRTFAMDVTPNVCKEGNLEGQYSPWMVVRRKRNGYKGATSGTRLEGTSLLTQNSPLPPSRNFSGRTSTTEYGPT